MQKSKYDNCEELKIYYLDHFPKEALINIYKDLYIEVVALYKTFKALEADIYKYPVSGDFWGSISIELEDPKIEDYVWAIIFLTNYRIIIKEYINEI